jgi:hypothetical protein
MKFKLYREYGSLNSSPVFNALQLGIKKLGYQETAANEDISVIWSVLWNGRMAPNQRIYEKNKNLGKKTLILEVGNFKRGHTWRLSLNHINKFGNFGNTSNLDETRLKKLDINLHPNRLNRRKEILIACQHDKSLQWAGQPPMHEWVNQTISLLRTYTDRKIIVRPHPRSPLKGAIVGGEIETPKKLIGTYDDYNIDYYYHCVINYNSGPGVQSALSGVPVICDYSSLAYDVSDQVENIENPQLKDRTEWILRLAHTEWTQEELASGEPLHRILREEG